MAPAGPYRVSWRMSFRRCRPAGGSAGNSYANSLPRIEAGQWRSVLPGQFLRYQQAEQLLRG